MQNKYFLSTIVIFVRHYTLYIFQIHELTMTLPLTLSTSIQTLVNVFPNSTNVYTDLNSYLKEIHELKKAVQRFGVMILLRLGEQGRTAIRILNKIVQILEEGINTFKKLNFQYANQSQNANNLKFTETQKRMRDGFHEAIENVKEALTQ